MTRQTNQNTQNLEKMFSQVKSLIDQINRCSPQDYKAMVNTTINTTVNEKPSSTEKNNNQRKVNFNEDVNMRCK